MLNFQLKLTQTKRTLKNQSAKANIIKGFTLLELIIVIIILGVMALGISGFIGLSTQTYLNVSERDDLLSSARFAVERLNRELRNAVPNSIRVIDDTVKQCIEFTPIKASTIYIKLPVVPDLKANEIDVVSFIDSQGDLFDCTGSCSDYIVVYPLKSSDIYNFDVNSGDGKVTQFKSFSSSTDDIWTVPIEPAGGMVFDEHSPTERLYVFDSTVSFCVSNFKLIRYQGNSFTTVQEFPSLGDSILMAEHLKFDKNNLPFKFLPVSLQRNAIVQVRLNFDRDGEIISFDNDIHIKNTP